MNTVSVAVTLAIMVLFGAALVYAVLAERRRTRDIRADPSRLDTGRRRSRRRLRP